MSRKPRTYEDQKIKKVSHRHEAIINWLCANPDRPLRDCAAYFGVRPQWMSILLNSDAFRARLNERQDALFSATVAEIRGKLEGITHQALDRLSDSVENTSDPKYILETADKMLHRLGYAPRGPGNHTPGQTNIQQNVYMADPAQLAQARELMEKAREVRAGNISPPGASEGSPTMPALEQSGEGMLDEED